MAWSIDKGLDAAKCEEGVWHYVPDFTCAGRPPARWRLRYTGPEGGTDFAALYAQKQRDWAAESLKAYRAESDAERQRLSKQLERRKASSLAELVASRLVVDVEHTWIFRSEADRRAGRAMQIAADPRVVAKFLADVQPESVSPTTSDAEVMAAILGRGSADRSPAQRLVDLASDARAYRREIPPDSEDEVDGGAELEIEALTAEQEAAVRLPEWLPNAVGKELNSRRILGAPDLAAMSEDELTNLPGIGTKTAKRLLAWAEAEMERAAEEEPDPDPLARG